ncbi:OmpA family protein [Aureivirga sp. CE67]|uniref:OmpA family protein n=1 Tax=Aureivirga sp. CE67 TaxID=1788983 RepID=UPI0018C9DC94|nr:OmpA family protein [Aureivirga sp. CE67]
MEAQFPEHGKNYAGVILHSENHYREYMQGELTETLQKDTIYNVTFYISLADNSHFATKNIDILFTNKKFFLKTKSIIKKRSLDGIKNLKYSLVSIEKEEYYTDKNRWMKIQTYYKSKGGEKYFSIGNFRKVMDIDVMKVNSTFNESFAYYYIDQVSISKKEIEKEEIEIIIPEEKEVFTINKTYIFKNVTFDFDSFKLTEAAKLEIQEVFDYLKNDEHLKIKITGHTDNLGKEDFNQKLSENRAKAVANYLMELGVSEDRVSAKGFGEKEPITTNDTEEGREQNRRVAFEFIEK